MKKIEVRDGDYAAIKRAFHILNNFATGGEMFVQVKPDEDILHGDVLASMLGRIERAVLEGERLP